MAIDVPKILLVFANPKRDLDAIRDEDDKIVNILRYAKNAEKTIDFDSLHDKELADIINSTVVIPGYQATLFHFSGHASETALLLPEGKTSGAAICTLLKYARTKIAFLNGCCTRGLIHDIFDQTEVRAAIATYSKVWDEVASKIAISFYTSFIRDKNNLQRTFELMQSSFRNYILSNGIIQMRDVQEMQDSEFPNKEANCFQWGLFYKDPRVLSDTIGTLQPSEKDAIISTISELEKKLNESEKELREDWPVPEGRAYEIALAKLELRKKEIAQWQNDLAAREEQEEKVRERQKIEELKKKFTDALKNINYFQQEAIYSPGNKNIFSAYAAIGDQDDLIPLLQIKLAENYELRNMVPYPINFTSGVVSSFWPELARHVGLNENSAKEKIVGTFIDEFFLEKGKPNSHQDILLKVHINNIPEDDVVHIVTEFWNTLRDYSQKLPVITSGRVKHKIIMLLIDEEANNKREELLRQKIDGFTIDPKTSLKVLPLISPLREDEIASWIRLRNLNTVGIAEGMASEIFRESNNGKIRKVIQMIKEKATKKEPTIKDLPLFNQLNI